VRLHKSPRFWLGEHPQRRGGSPPRFVRLRSGGSSNPTCFHSDTNGKKTRLSFSFIREWNDDDYDVLANGSEAGRIAGARWMRTLAFGCYEDQPPTHCYAVTRGAAMAAFAKKWRGSKWQEERADPPCAFGL
jgi:hypothetical protein